MAIQKTGGVICQFCLTPLGERKNFVEQVREFTNIGKLLEKACKGMGLHFLTQLLPGEKKEICRSQSILSSLHPQKILNLLPNFQINEISRKNLDFGLLLKMSKLSLRSHNS